MRRAWIALGIALAACGGDKASKPDEAAPRAKDAAPVEVVHPRYYRAPGGTAAIRYPELGDAWTTSLDRDNDPPSVKLVFDDRAGGAAQVHVLFPPRTDRPATPEEAARDAAATLASEVQGTIADGKAIGPNAYVVRVLATQGDVSLTSAVMAIVDGTALALIVAIGTDAGLKAAAPGYAAILEGVSVGAMQPTPPPADPGQPLDGVYIHTRSLGGYEALVFDPRGYVHTDDDLVADLDAIWSIRDGELDRYTFDGQIVTITPPAGEPSTGKLAGNELTMFGDRYCRASGRVPARLEGHWELVDGGYTNANAYDTFSFVQRGDYYFTRDGTFSFSSFAHASSTNTRSGGAPIKARGTDVLGNPTEAPEVHTSAEGGDHGTYEIVADRIHFTGADGSRAAATIYAAGCDQDADDRTGVLFLGGAIYLRAKS